MSSNPRTGRKGLEALSQGVASVLVLQGAGPFKGTDDAKRKEV